MWAQVIIQSSNVNSWLHHTWLSNKASNQVFLSLLQFSWFQHLLMHPCLQPYCMGARPAVSQAQELFSFHFNHRDLSQPLCIAAYPHHLWSFLVLPSTTFQLSNTRNLTVGSCLSTNFKYADYSCIVWASAESGNRTRSLPTDTHLLQATADLTRLHIFILDKYNSLVRQIFITLSRHWGPSGRLHYLYQHPSFFYFFCLILDLKGSL